MAGDEREDEGEDEWQDHCGDGDPHTLAQEELIHHLHRERDEECQQREGEDHHQREEGWFGVHDS